MITVAFSNPLTPMIVPDEVVTITPKTRVLRVLSFTLTRERQTVREFQLPWPGRVAWIRALCGTSTRRLANLKLAAIDRDGKTIGFYSDRVVVTRERMSSRLRVDGPEAGRIFPTGTVLRATTFYVRRSRVDLPEVELLVGVLVGAE